MGKDTKTYIEQLIEKNIPKKILACMIYYPDESDVTSWASNTLNALNYSKNPSILQSLTQVLFERGTKQITMFLIYKQDFTV